MTNPTPRDSAQLPPQCAVADGLNIFYEGRFDGESEEWQKQRLYWASQLQSAQDALRAQAASPAGMAVYQGIADGYQRDAQASSVEPVELAAYDAGLLNDFGGGNVGWWWDYIRHELGSAHDFYQEQQHGA